VNKDREQRGEAAAAGALGEDERAELARLRRENAELAMERDDAPMFVKWSMAVVCRV
jgi:transposase